MIPPCRQSLLLTARDVDHVMDIVDGLREWFTSNAGAGIASDALRFSSFVIEERECCCEILWLAVERDYHGRGYGPYC